MNPTAFAGPLVVVSNIPLSAHLPAGPILYKTFEAAYYSLLVQEGQVTQSMCSSPVSFQLHDFSLCQSKDLIARNLVAGKDLQLCLPSWSP